MLPQNVYMFGIMEAGTGRQRYLNIAFRLFVGIVFIVAGVSKLIGPAESFFKVYTVLPGGIPYFYVVLPWVEVVILPWLEIVLGSLLIMGFFRRIICVITLILLTTFMIANGIVISRGEPQEMCPCFGSLVHPSPWFSLAMDIALFLIVLFLLLKPYSAVNTYETQDGLNTNLPEFEKREA